MSVVIPFLQCAGLLLLLAIPYAFFGWRRDRKARIIARQIELTDAIYAELGAAAAPFITKPALGPWRVRYSMPSGGAAVERLVAITHRVLAGRGATNVEIVFTLRRPARLRAA